MRPLHDYIPVDPLEGTTVRCYRYLGSHWLDSITRMELKTADVDDFNDIFDGRGAVSGHLSIDVARRHTLKEVVGKVPGITTEMVNRSFDQLGDDVVVSQFSDCIRQAVVAREGMHESRIVCFSRPDTGDADCLMWSHYANNWKGVRLGFDLLYDIHREIDFGKMTTPFMIEPVRYSDDRPVMDLSRLEDIIGDTYYIACFRNFMLTKSKAWEYEHEWRMLVLKHEAEVRYVNNKPMHFWKFHPQLLRRVDIGPLVSSEERNEIVYYLNLAYPHVEVNQVVLDDKTYGFKYAPVKSSGNFPVEL